MRTALKLRDEWSTATGPPFDAGRELLLGRFRELFAVVPPTPTALPHTANDLLGGSESPPDTRYLGVGDALVS